MTRARFWKLQINLDTFNSGFAALDGPQEQADFLVGLSRGMNSGKVKDDCSDPMSVGFALGSEMRQEAEGFKVACSINGSKRKSNKNDHTVNHLVEAPCTLSNNPQSNNLLTNTQEPGKTNSASRPRSAAGKKSSETQPIPEELNSVLSYLCANWPLESWGKEGEPSRPVQRLTPKSLWERVNEVSLKCDVEVGPLIFAGLPYVRSLMKMGVDGRVKFAKNMSNFWGIDKESRLWDTFYPQGESGYKSYMEKAND